MTKKIFLILDNIRSRENVGSIFRTADATGVSKVFLCGITPTPKAGNPKSEILNSRQILSQISDKISKTALGAEKWVPWEYRRQTGRLINEFKEKKIMIVGLEIGNGGQSLYKFRPVFPLAIILGNEVKGISRRVLSLADRIVYIPMHGKKESLNVSVAAGVATCMILGKK